MDASTDPEQRTIRAEDVAGTLRGRLVQHQLAARTHGASAEQHLRANPPNFSAAATDAHRAHQHALQANTCRELLLDFAL